jgi:hypothetical protein
LTLGEDLKKDLGGLEIIHLGERFKESKAVGGWLVPFEVRLKDGKSLAENAAMRSDNQANRYVLVNPLMLEMAMARLPDNEKYEKLPPEEAALAFLQACAKKDWDEAQKFCRKPLEEQFKKAFGAMQLVSLGKPFQQPEKYHGWYIPYEIKLKDGTVKKFNLAMYKDKSAKRHLWDGGL